MNANSPQSRLEELLADEIIRRVMERDGVSVDDMRTLFAGLRVSLLGVPPNHAVPARAGSSL